jgi:hypothetical protein
MKLIRLMTLAAASFIAGTTFAIGDTPARQYSQGPPCLVF